MRTGGQAARLPQAGMKFVPTAQLAEVWKDKLPTRVSSMAPSTRAEAGKTLRARSRSGFIASANMANVLALFGNMFAFKGSFQAEVRAASTSRFPARVATVVVSSRDDVVRDARPQAARSVTRRSETRDASRDPRRA